MTEKISDSATVLQKVSAKTARGRRILQKRGPQVVEEVKTACFIRGTTTSPIVSSVLTSLLSLKKPDGVLCQKRNAVHPFDEQSSKSANTLNFLMQKNGSTFAVVASHSKKRPNALTLVRSFDHQVLDMAELLVTSHQPISRSASEGCMVGTKPCFVVIGEQWELNDRFKMVKNLLIDMFRGRVVESLDLLGLESCIVLTAIGEDKILFRTYRVALKASGTATPSVHLSSMGPHFDFSIGRTKPASFELWNIACRQPRELTGGVKRKNVSRTKMGETLGRVHVGKQNIDTIQTRKVKALKKPKQAKVEKTN